jgi:hypothetical protein
LHEIKKKINKNLGAYYNFSFSNFCNEKQKKYQTKPLLLLLVRSGEKKGVVLPYHFVIYE